MKTAFVSDSGTGLSLEESKKYGIFSVPLQVIYNSDSKQDLEEIKTEEIWQLLAQKNVVTTSLPSIGLIEELILSLKNEGYERIFCISITQGISSTADTFKLVANQHNIEFIYFDCYTTAFIQRYLIIQSKKMYDLGYSIEEIINNCDQVVKNSETFILPSSCEQLIRSGKLTGFAATIAGLLKIKPWLHINIESNGKIDALGKGRSHEKIISKTIDVLKEKVKEHYNIYVVHADAFEHATQIKEKLGELFKNVDIFLDKLIAPVSVHTGIGCIAIQYFPKLRLKDESN